MKKNFFTIFVALFTMMFIGNSAFADESVSTDVSTDDVTTWCSYEITEGDYTAEVSMELISENLYRLTIYRSEGDILRFPNNYPGITYTDPDDSSVKTYTYGTASSHTNVTQNVYDAEENAVASLGETPGTTLVLEITSTTQPYFDAALTNAVTGKSGNYLALNLESAGIVAFSTSTSDDILNAVTWGDCSDDDSSTSTGTDDGDGTTTVTVGPTEAATAPTYDANKVISVYSDSYTTGVVASTSSYFFVPTYETVDDNEYAIMDHEGSSSKQSAFVIEKQDLTSMEYLQFSYWVDEADVNTTINITMLTYASNGTTSNPSRSYSLTTVGEGWQTVTIPFTYYSDDDDVVFDYIWGIKFSEMKSGGIIYVDDVIFFTTSDGSSTGDGSSTDDGADTDCYHESDVASEGEFSTGYTIEFETLADGTSVTVTAEIFDADKTTGLVAYLWDYTYTNDTFESSMGNLGDNKVSYTLTGLTDGSTISCAVKFAYAGGMTVTSKFDYVVGTDCSVELETIAPEMTSATLVAESETYQGAQITVAGTDVEVEGGEAVAVTKFKVMNGTTEVGTFTAVDGVITVTGLEAETLYTVTVYAVDNAGNVSADGIDVTFTTIVKITAPTTAATKPEQLAANVYSFFSDAYTTSATNLALNPYWGQPSYETYYQTEVVTGDFVAVYPGMTYQGIQFDAMNALAYDYIHIDLWMADDATIQLYPITGDAEQYIELAVVGGQWNPFDVAVSDYTALGMNMANMYQFKLANGNGADVYVDNLYLWREPSEDSVAPTALAVTVDEDATTYKSITLDLYAEDDCGTVSYDITYGDGLTATAGGTSGATTTTTISGLTAETEYTFSVVAYDINDNTTEAVTATATTAVHPAAPATTPDAPTADAADVISVYGDTYTQAMPFTYANWGSSTTYSEYAIDAENSVMMLSDFGYCGLEFGTTYDLTSCTYLHFDVWSETMTSIQVTPVGSSETLNTYTLAVQEGWNSVDFALTNFTAVDFTQVGQFKFAGGNNSDIVYIDNLYFYKRTLSAPTFGTEAGNFTDEFTLTLTAEAGATIYYTTDETDPTTSSAVYTDGIAISKTTTIRAIAVLDELTSSVVEAVYQLQVSTGVRTNDGYTLVTKERDDWSGTYILADVISDGSYYIVSSALASSKNMTYVAATNIASNTTISGYEVTIAKISGTDYYSIKLGGGKYLGSSTSTTNVSSSSIEGTYYYWDIQDGGYLYNVGNSRYLALQSEGKGYFNMKNDATMNVPFEFWEPNTTYEDAVYVTDAPEFGSDVAVFTSSEGMEVSLTAEANATIYYTTDGVTEPTAEITQLYTGAFTVTETTTVKAIAICYNGTASEVVTTTYTYFPAPTFSVTAETFTEDFDLVLTSVDGATIYYNMYGDDYSVYTGAIAIDKTRTVNAYAVYGGVTSETATYTFSEIDGDGNVIAAVPYAPAFSHEGGQFTDEFVLTLSSDGIIYYTTDESTPTSESAVYTDGIAISKTTTVKAIAILDGVSSEEVSVVYTKVSIAYASYEQQLTISDDYSGKYLIVWWNTEDSDGGVYSSINSTVSTYTGTVGYSTSSNFANFSDSYNSKEVTIAKVEGKDYYTLKLYGGSYIGANSSTTDIFISSTTVDSDNYYWTLTTLDRDDETELNFNIANVGTGGYMSALGGDYDYYLMDNSTAFPLQFWFRPVSYTEDVYVIDAPEFSEEETAFANGPFEVEISAEMGAYVYYTTDGEDIVLDYTTMPYSSTNGKLYEGETLSFSETTTLKAIAISYHGYYVSDVASVTYTYLPAPEFSAPDGTEFDALSYSYTFSSAVSGAFLFYTTDGTDPIENGTIYSGETLTIGETTTIKAVASYGGVYSNVATATYTNTSALIFSEVEPTFVGAFTLYITATDPTATVYYTMDGSDPTTESNLYTSAGVEVSMSMKIRAIAVTEDASSRIYEITYSGKTLVSSDYVKVTEEKFDYSGEYIIVCEYDSKCYVVKPEIFTSSSSYKRLDVYSCSKIEGNFDDFSDYVFTVASVDGGYSIRSNDNGNYINFSSTYFSLSSSAYAWDLSQVENGYIYSTDQSTNKYMWLYLSGPNIYASSTYPNTDGKNAYLWEKVETWAEVAAEPDAPVFSTTTTDFSQPISLTIEGATDYATVYYTLDGTEPTADSYVYTDGDVISITETTTVKAIAIYSTTTKAQSEVVSATYTYYVVAPEFSEEGGSMYNPFTLTLKAESTSTILYTTEEVTTGGSEGTTFYLNPGIWSTEDMDFYLFCSNSSWNNVTFEKMSLVEGEDNLYTATTDRTDLSYVTFYTVATGGDPSSYSSGALNADFYDLSAITGNEFTVTEYNSSLWCYDGTWSTYEVAVPAEDYTTYTEYEDATGIVINGEMTVKAVAEDANGNYSELVEATYIYTVADPVLTVESTVFNESFTVEMSSLTTSATIYYTKDGSEPTSASAPYTEAITIENTTTVKAIAIDTYDNTSEIVSATYTYLAAPAFTVEAGNFTDPITLTLSAIDGATIYYTTIGTDPATEGVEYTSPITITKTTTVRAIAVYGELTSAEQLNVYTLVDENNEPVAWVTDVPEFSREETAFVGEFDLTMTAEYAATIYYTLDGTDPNPSNYDADAETTIITYAGEEINISETTTVRAVAFAYNGIDSEEVSVEYIRLDMPTFSVTATAFDIEFELTIESDLEDAVIYYTLDGSTPISGRNEFTEDIIISSNTTVKAIAVLEGVSSEMAEISYTAYVDLDYTYTKVTEEREDYDGTYILAAEIDDTYYVFAGVNADSRGDIIECSDIASSKAMLVSYELSVATSTYVSESPLSSGSVYYTIQQGNGKYIIGLTNGVDITEATSHVSTYSSDMSGWTESYGDWNFTSAYEGSTANVVTTAKGNGSSYNLRYSTANDDVRLSTNTSDDYLQMYWWRASGTATAAPETVEAPEFSVESGIFSSEFSFTISTDTKEATIYYTTDGSEPTRESDVYTGAITVLTSNAYLNVKAIAIAGPIKSEVVSVEYTYEALYNLATLIQQLGYAEKYPDYYVDATLNAMTVTYVSETDTWVTDASSNAALRLTGYTGVVNGDILSGIKGKVSYDADSDYEMVNYTAGNISVATGEAVSPEETTVSDVKATYSNRFVTFTGTVAYDVTLADDQVSFVLANDGTVNAYTYFSNITADLYAGDNVTVVGLVSAGNGTPRINVITLTVNSSDDTATDVEGSESSDFVVYSNGGAVYVEAEAGAAVQAYGINGQLLFSSQSTASNLTEISGQNVQTMIVVVNGSAVKVAVK